MKILPRANLILEDIRTMTYRPDPDWNRLGGGLLSPSAFVIVVICPMRQQHWTDYKISLCVCQ